jgi:predicted PurR-regulated permease PerM
MKNMNSYLKKFVLENQILWAAGTIGLLFLLWDIRGILASLFIAYILATALTPAVNYLQNHKVPRSLAPGIVFLLTVTCLVGIIFPLVPFVIKQTSSFITLFPDYLNRVGPLFNWHPETLNLPSFLQSEADVIGKNAWLLSRKLFGGVLSLVTTTVISFYLLVNRQSLHRFFLSFFSQDKKDAGAKFLEELDTKLGAWFRGQLFLSFIIGFFTWVGLTVIGIPQALPLAIIAGILEIIPTVGPILSAIPAIVVALSISGPLALIVAGLYIFIQMAENHFIVPKVMQTAVGFNPLAVIVGILIGGNLMGVLGALLAVPIILVISEIKKLTDDLSS